MKIKPSSYFLMFVLAAMLAVIGMMLNYPRIETKALPITVSGLVFLLAANELRVELKSAKEAREEKAAKKRETSSGGAARGYIVAGSWLIGLFAAIYLVGFAISTVLFTFSYLKVNKRGWLLSAFIALFIAAFIYGIFKSLLKIDLYPGLLGII